MRTAARLKINVARAASHGGSWDHTNQAAWQLAWESSTMRLLIAAFLTVALSAGLLAAQERPARVRPTHANVSYGPHARNVMDVWLATTDRPTPLLVSIVGTVAKLHRVCFRGPKMKWRV
jgi:hypothetical protein